MPDPTDLLGEPILILSSTPDPVLLNNRVLASPDALYSAGVDPGGLVLVSMGDPLKQEGTAVKRSSFAPPLLEKDLFWKHPPHQQGRIWGQSIDQECGIGDFCFVCEIWPNSKLQKDQIQIPAALQSVRHPVLPGTLLYLHSFNFDSPVCQKLHITLLQGDPVFELKLQETDLGIKVLKKLILSQIQDRVLLKGNLIPVLVLGGVLLYKVLSLEAQSTSTEAARIHSDHTVIELEEQEKTGEDDYLKAVQEASNSGLQSSQKDAAESAALLAAKQGLNQNQNHSEIFISETLTQTFQSLVISPLLHPEIFPQMGLTPPKGVVLYGPPGSGKSALVRWLAKTSKANFFVINGPSLVSEYYGGSESGLTGVFSAAKALTPSIIFFDELDAIFTDRTQNLKTSGSILRMLTALLTEFDNMTPGVVVLGATNQIDVLDLALRRPGRFDREIEIGVPSANSRRCIFGQYLTQIMHSITQQEMDEISDGAHGFLPSDISALFQEASMSALRRSIKTNSISAVSYTDLKIARALIRPSGLREIQVEVPKTHWEDIGGLEEIKQQLKECIEWPISHQDSLQRLGIIPPRGVLLFGPPGCSKTLLAKAIATETGMNFISMKGSELLSAFVGQSEKSIAQLFNHARQVAPCVVFFDEIDGLLGMQNGRLSQRVLAQMLLELDGVRKRGEVVVIGATNIPQALDPALLRPGRFDRLILVPPPDQESRKAIFKVHLKRLSVGDDVDVGVLAERTEGFSGADIAGVCWEAGIEALEEDMDSSEISMRHFVKAVERSVPSVNLELTLEVYRFFQRSVVNLSTKM